MRRREVTHPLSHRINLQNKRGIVYLDPPSPPDQPIRLGGSRKSKVRGAGESACTCLCITQCSWHAQETEDSSDVTALKTLLKRMGKTQTVQFHK